MQGDNGKINRLIVEERLESLPRNFIIKFKKIFGVTNFGDKNKIIINRKIDEHHLNLFFKFYEIFSFIYPENSKNWNSFTYFIYELNPDFYAFIENEDAGLIKKK
jgi:hypothetical protein